MLLRIAILLLLGTTQSIAATIQVFPFINSLHKAIDEARDNDTLFIHQGLYNEHDIIIDKKITLKGIGYPVIDGANKYQLFIVTSDSVTIEYLRIQNTGRSSISDIAGVKLQNVSHVVVRNNLLLYDTYGVYLQHCSDCEIFNNIIFSKSEDELNSGNGIHAWKSERLNIRNNKISGHRDGIYFEFVATSIISGNISVKNIRYGLHFMFSGDDTYIGNQFIDNGAGVAVMYSNHVTMKDNSFSHNWGAAAYGILLKEISDGIIQGNIFSKNTVGIYMEGTNRIIVQRNEFIENGWAMKIQASCNANTIELNNFLSNSFDVATNGTMMLNKFSRNYWDKYDGYDLDKDRVGDVPYYPVSIYTVITERVPIAMMLYRSFITDIMDQVEKVIPSIIPDQLKDDQPMIKKWQLK